MNYFLRAMKWILMTLLAFCMFVVLVLTLIGIIIFTVNFAFKSMKPTSGPVWEAAREGNIAYLKDYVEKGGDIENRTQKSDFSAGDWTLLMTAADVGNIKSMEFLIEHGADVNAHTKSNTTPLIAAIKSGQIEAIKWLLAHGAQVDPNAVTTVVSGTQYYKTEAGWGSSSMAIGHFVSDDKRKEILKMLADARFPLNEPNPYGETPIQKAARFGGDEAIVKALIDLGVDKQQTFQTIPEGKTLTIEEWLNQH